MSCGIDLWDVERYVRAGGVVACERCVDVMAQSLAAAAGGLGPIDVVVPPRLHGDAPDEAALGAVTAALFAVFGGGSAAERATTLEDAETLGPVIDQVTQQYAGFDPRLVVDRVRFPTADLAEVRFRFVLHGGPGGIDGVGQVVRRGEHWLVTRETVLTTLPGGHARIIASGGAAPPPFGVGGVGFNRVALWSQSADDGGEDDDEPPDGPVPARV